MHDFDALVAEHWSAVHALARRLTRHGADAEDATQQTFFQAFRAWASFDGRAAARTWLYRIAIRVVARQQTERERRPGALAEHAAEAEEPLEQLERDEEAELVRRALLGLTPIHRLVLTLFTLEGLKAREIAELLECPEGTVWSRLDHARAALQERIEARRKERSRA